MIYSTRPVRNAVLGINSRSLLTFYFRLTTYYNDEFYLKINIKDYNIVPINPTNCLVKYW